MATPLSACDFIMLSQDVPVIDVRTPAEFAKGHVPGAINMPLFHDPEFVSQGVRANPPPAA
jgi:tRNA 2-selenouridine synthase